MIIFIMKGGNIVARPRKRRRVCCLPESNLFGPLNGDVIEENFIAMTVDEYETIRLIDFEGMTQEECADRMNVARTTVQRTYIEARKKLAESLVNGNILRIGGGDYRLYNENEKIYGCGRCRGHGRNMNFKMGNNGVLEEEISVKIAIPVVDNIVETKISPNFGRATYFLIYDVETKEITFIDNTSAASQGGAGIKAAQVIVDSGAEILITPRAGENAAEVIQSAGIKIYKTLNDSVQDNIDAFIEGKLSLLQDIHSGFHNHGGN